MPRKTIHSSIRPIGDDRLTPPDYLSEEDATLFRQIVESLPADHFQVSDRPLLAQYCTLAGACARCDQNSEAEMKFMAEMSRTMAGLAQKMRLVSSAHLNRATRTKRAHPKPWKSTVQAPHFTEDGKHVFAGNRWYTAEEWKAKQQ
jgi:hypothetical protein